jgi:hypothetical protein
MFGYMFGDVIGNYTGSSCPDVVLDEVGKRMRRQMWSVNISCC